MQSFWCGVKSEWDSLDVLYVNSNYNKKNLPEPSKAFFKKLYSFDNLNT